MIIITILLFTVFSKDYFNVHPVEAMQSIECNINGENFTYKVWQSKEFSYVLDKIVTQDKELKLDITKYINFQEVFEAIEENVVSRGGSC